MKKLLGKYKMEPKNVLKFSGAALVVIIILVFVYTLVSSSLRPFLNTIGRVGMSTSSVAPSYDMGGSYGESDAYGGKAMPPEVPELSSRNMLPYPQGGGTSGNDAEEFEVTDYSAYIETRNKDTTCKTVADLKTLSYVIFENATKSDTGCGYTFKVEHSHVEEILTVLKTLNPKDLTENSYTIKEQIEDFTSETEILEKKRASIDETLENALSAYDKITLLATQTQDVASLAKIIDSKIQIIERLTQERININEQLDRLGRSKAQQVDRLEYTYFHVSVSEKKFIDGEALKDSWQESIRNFVHSVNFALQNATINLIAFLFGIIPLILYFFILIVVAKYGWRGVLYVWKK